MHHEQRQDVRQHRRSNPKWRSVGADQEERWAGPVVRAAVAGSITPFAAESADDLKLPASFRNWYHVNTMVIDKGSPLFEAMGGMHNVYINSTGETALKKGEPYPDKTVLLVDLHEFTISDGSYVEGPRKATAIMLKDKKKYASTGGWGSEEGPRLRVFNLHPVSARWISWYDLGARVWAAFRRPVRGSDITLRGR